MWTKIIISLLLYLQWKRGISKDKRVIAFILVGVAVSNTRFGEVAHVNYIYIQQTGLRTLTSRGHDQGCDTIRTSQECSYIPASGEQSLQWLSHITAYQCYCPFHRQHQFRGVGRALNEWNLCPHRQQGTPEDLFLCALRGGPEPTLHGPADCKAL